MDALLKVVVVRFVAARREELLEELERAADRALDLRLGLSLRRLLPERRREGVRPLGLVEMALERRDKRKLAHSLLRQ